MPLERRRRRRRRRIIGNVPLAPIITTRPDFTDEPEPDSGLIIVRRGVWAAVAFMLGLTLGRSLPGVPGTLWLGLCAALLATAMMVAGRGLGLLLLLATVLGGAGWFAVRVHEVPTDSLAVFYAGEPAAPEDEDLTAVAIIVSGMVMDRPVADPGEPDPLMPGFGRGPTTRFELELDAVQVGDTMQPASGRLRVLVREPLSDQRPLRAGDRVRVRGTYEPIASPRFAGEEDSRPWAAQENRVGRLVAASAAMMTAQDDAAGMRAGASRAWRSLLSTVRAAASGAFAEAMGDDSRPGPEPTARAMLGALLIGTQDRALAPTSGVFSRLGLVHILSISGFHLALMAAMLSVALRFVGDWPRVFAVVVGLVVSLYLLIVPAEAPVLRSGIAVLVFLLCEAAGRRYDRLNVLALIAVGLLIWRPMDLFAAGFQLSFGITAALIWLSGPLHQAWFGPGLLGGYQQGSREKHTPLARAARWLKQALTGAISTGVLAWAVSTPVVIFHTGLVAPLAILIGLPLTAVFSILLGLGYAVLLLALAWPQSLMGQGPVAWCGSVLERLSEWTLAITNWLDVLPGMSLALPKVSIAWTILATLAALAWLIPRQMQPWRRLDRHSLGRFAISSVALLWLAFTIAAAARGPAATATTSGWVRDEFVLSKHVSPVVLARRAGESVLTIPEALSGRDLSRAIPSAVRAVGGWQVRVVELDRSAGPRPGRGLAEGLDELVARLGVMEVVVDPAFARLAAQRPNGEEGKTAAILERRGVRISVHHGAAADRK